MAVLVFLDMPVAHRKVGKGEKLSFSLSLKPPVALVRKSIK